MKKTEGKGFKPVYFVVIILAIIVAIGFVILGYKSNVINIDPIPSFPGGEVEKEDEVVRNGKLSLDFLHGQKVYGSEEEMSILLLAESDGKEVSGFDVILSLDGETDAAITEVESMVEGYSVVESSDAPAYAFSLVTDYEAGNVQGIVFEGTPIANITLVSKKTGPIDLDFDFEVGDTTDTNLITMTNMVEDTLGFVEGTTIYVGETVTLQNGQSVTTPDNITFTLTHEGTPQDCIDCTTDALLVVTDGTTSENLQFSTGGFEGVLNDSEEAFGYIFEVGNGTENTLEIRYAMLMDTHEK